MATTSQNQSGNSNISFVYPPTIDVATFYDGGVDDAFSSFTFSHTVSGGNYLVVGVDAGNPHTMVSGITYDNVALSPIVPQSTANYQLFGLLNPSIGTHDVVITLLAACGLGATAVSYKGVNSFSPLGSGIQASATNAYPSATLSTTAGDRVIGFIMNWDGGVFTDTGLNQIQRADGRMLHGGDWVHFADLLAESTTTTWSASMANGVESWYLKAIPLHGTLIISQTQSGVSRVTVTSDLIQSGIARITTITSQTQFGNSNLIVTIPQSQLGGSRITVATIQIQLGNANIFQSSEQYLLGISDILGVSLDQSQLGQSCVLGTHPSSPVYIDNFDREERLLQDSGIWDYAGGVFIYATGTKAELIDPDQSGETRIKSLATGNQYVQAKLYPTDGNMVGLVLRSTGVNIVTEYRFFTNGLERTGIQKIVDGFAIELINFDVQVMEGDTIKFTALGYDPTVLYVYQNGTLLGTYVDRINPIK